MAVEYGLQHDRTMIELHTMVPAYGLPTFTPFGLKLIAYLHLTNIPFRMVEEVNPNHGPKGKFPWLVDGSHVVADSDFVVRHLIAHHGANLDAGMTDVQRAHAHALRRMVEESLCFCILYFRWVDTATYRLATDVALGALPSLVRTCVRPLVRRRILRDLRGQGISRHSGEEVAELGRADLHALAEQLGEQDYLFGATPRLVDASAAAFLAVLLYPPFDNPLKRQAQQLSNLVAYAERMRCLCFETLAS